MENGKEMGNVQIRRATTPQELDKVYRLRYKVYAENMGYNFPKENGPVIIDSFDETAVIFYLEKNNETIGTVRVNTCDLEKMDVEFEQKWALWKFRDKYTEVLYTSRLMLLPDHRDFSYLTLLCETVEAYFLEKKIKVNLIESRRELLPLYKLMGFREYHEPFIDAILGELVPLVLIPEEK